MNAPKPGRPGRQGRAFALALRRLRLRLSLAVRISGDHKGRPYDFLQVRWFVFGVVAALLSAVGHGGEASRTMAIEVSPGTSKVVGFDADVGAAFIADPATADVNVLDTRTLFVLGIAPGITSLKVHDANGELLAAYAVRVNAQTEYANTVIDRVVGDDGDVRVESVGNALFVSGSAKSPAQAELLLRGIRAVSGAPVVDALTTATPPQVNLDVMISEVSRNVTQELGIDWSIDLNPFEIPLRTWATGTGFRLGSGALQLANIDETGEVAFANEVNELGVVMPNPRGAEGGVVLSHTKEINSSKYRATAFIEALAQNGLVTVHARPSLTTVSGEPAEFFSGLEVPVPTISERGVVGTEYRQTGVSLSFTPTVLDEDQISLTVLLRIREIAAGGATIAGAVVPNINERSASTTVELGNGESIAIAGLYRRNTTASDSGIPVLKDIPVWGGLFRTGRETDRSVELIIVVTPRIVAAVPDFSVATSPDPSAAARQLDNEFFY